VEAFVVRNGGRGGFSSNPTKGKRARAVLFRELGLLLSVQKRSGKKKAYERQLSTLVLMSGRRAEREIANARTTATEKRMGYVESFLSKKKRRCLTTGGID